MLDFYVNRICNFFILQNSLRTIENKEIYFNIINKSIFKIKVTQMEHVKFCS